MIYILAMIRGFIHYTKVARRRGKILSWVKMTHQH